MPQKMSKFGQVSLIRDTLSRIELLSSWTLYFGSLMILIVHLSRHLSAVTCVGQLHNAHIMHCTGNHLKQVEYQRWQLAEDNREWS